MVQRITQTKKMADSLTVRRLALRLQAEKVNKLVASLAEEVSGQRNWRTFFPDHRCVQILTLRHSRHISLYLTDVCPLRGR